MAGILETITTEKDEARSRNTLDDEEELAAALARSSRVEQGIVFTRCNGQDECVLETNMVVVTTEEATEKLLKSMVGGDKVTEVGHLTSDTVVSSVSKIQVSESCYIVLVAFPGNILEEDCSALAWELMGIDKLAEAKRWVVLGTMKTTQYSNQGVREDPPLVRWLATTKEAKEECKSLLKLKPLETGNIVTGICAAVMSECMFSGVEYAYSLLSLRESHLEPDTMLALVDPVLSALSQEAAEGETTNLRPREEIVAAAGQIKEVRAIDRELLYI